MDNYKEQYTNKKGDKRIEIEMVTYCFPCWLLWTPPTSKYHYWTFLLDKMLFKSFNNKNTTTEKKRQEQIPKEEKKGKNIRDIVFIIMKKRDKNKYQKKKKELK